MNLAQELMEHVSKAAAIFARLEEEVPRYEERILAVGPRLKELESIEGRIRTEREVLEQLTKTIERVKKDYAAVHSTFPLPSK